MPSSSEVVLVTGAGSGIGRALAETFYAQGATVIIAGRTAGRLQAVAASHPGMEVEVVDVAEAAEVEALAERVAARHPDLNVLINNAGVQQLLDFTATPPSAEVISYEIDVNLKGLIQVSAAFLPLLHSQPRAKLVHVGSGLGFVPLAAAPVYSATKAAVHSFTLSLRRQLATSRVKVVEIIPPVVETELHRHQGWRPPDAMPLADFIREAMAGLTAGREEITIGRARALRLGARIAPNFFLNIVNKPRA